MYLYRVSDLILATGCIGANVPLAFTGWLWTNIFLLQFLQGVCSGLCSTPPAMNGWTPCAGTSSRGSGGSPAAGRSASWTPCTTQVGYKQVRDYTILYLYSYTHTLILILILIQSCTHILYTHIHSFSHTLINLVKLIFYLWIYVSFDINHSYFIHLNHC